MNFSVKICASTWEDAKYWGDYHVALALKKYLGRHGSDTTIQIMPEWYNGEDGDCDVVIHLRGLHRYAVSEKHLNIMWNFNHLDTISIDEYESYDIVFVASEIHAPKLARLLRTKVVPLLLCTDAEIFYPRATEGYTSDLLFVGNSRNVYRKIIKDLLPTSHDLQIWGTLWEQFVDKKYIQGDYFPNEDLGRLYSSCKILLNDHWDDMRELGFINMRMFDALASKAFVISDDVAGIDDVVPDGVVIYHDSADLHAKVAYYLENERARLQIAEKGYEFVTKHHTFENRVATIIGLAWSLLREKSLGRGIRGRKKGEEVLSHPVAAGKPLSEFNARLSVRGAPRSLKSSAVTHIRVSLMNVSRALWPSGGNPDARYSINLSYHWIDRNGNIVVFDGMRTSLTAPVPPDGETVLEAVVMTPPLPQEYTLEFDLVQEGVAWFKDKGSETAKVSLSVESGSRED